MTWPFHDTWNPLTTFPTCPFPLTETTRRTGMISKIKPWPIVGNKNNKCIIRKPVFFEGFHYLSNGPINFHQYITINSLFTFTFELIRGSYGNMRHRVRDVEEKRLILVFLNKRNSAIGIHRCKLRLDDQSQLTTMYTNRAVSFIEKHKNEPFFLYVPHSMPHVPIAASDKFKGKSEQGVYGDVLMEIDWSVGQVMETLEKNGLSDNTLIIFVSDNGPWLNFGNHAGSAGGLREGKGTSWEGGQRVPCIMKWPGHIPEGLICNKIAATIDILPTLAAITESALPINKIDGVNILSLMSGDQKANPREVFLYYYNSNCLEAVRKNQWKLVFSHRSQTYEGFAPGKDGVGGKTGNVQVEPALYDLRRDPGERYDVKDLNPEIIVELMKIADEGRYDLGDGILNIKGANVREPGRISAQ